MSRARWATWSVTGASWERRGTSFPGRRPRRPSAARMRRRVDVDGREDVGGGRSVHMPVSQVASDLSGGRGIERPWDLTRHGDEELLQHLHAHAALTGIPQLLEKGVRPVYLEAFLYYKKNLHSWPDLVIEEINTIPFFTKYYIKQRN